jgi:hypothetical protein
MTMITYPPHLITPSTLRTTNTVIIIIMITSIMITINAISSYRTWCIGRLPALRI